MRGENKRAAKAVAVIVHHFKVMTAESGVIGFFADIVLHIGRTKNKGDSVLFRFALQKAERAFVSCAESVHQRNGCDRFFYHRLFLLFFLLYHAQELQAKVLCL